MEENKEELVDFFKKEETIKKVTALAIQFHQVFGFEWFTLNQCMGVFKEASVEQIVDIIRSLQLCGFVIGTTKKKTERFRLGKNQFEKMTDAIRGDNNDNKAD